ncbi:MAG TPA: GMC family oxidoreductase [Gemmatimonadales bacterium]|nr:GMC family oxidoreductase [Gemmatimonadales bacterium]
MPTNRGRAMIVDAHKGFGGEPSRYDICIVGAGPAGISLALQFEATRLRVCVLEAGGPTYAAVTQRLFEGEVVAERYLPLRETRVGALGGSTNVWAGWCRPLEQLDFESREWCAAPGWPFGFDQLRPYYARAHEVCGLAAFEYEPAHWAGVLGHPRLLAGDQTFDNQIFQVQIQNFAHRYFPELERSKNIDLVLHAPVVDLRLERGACTAVRVRTLQRNEFAISADRFVLAAGGVENARLLLLSAESPQQAPGNAHGLVGRYFTDHPYIDPGFMVLREPDPLNFYQPQPVAPSRTASSVRGVLTLRPEVTRRERLMQGAFFFHPQYEAHRVFASDEVKAFLRLRNKFKNRAVPGDSWAYARRAAKAPHRVLFALARKLAVRQGPSRRWRMRAMFETEFRFANRVTLSDEYDRLGRRQPRVEWQLGENDIDNMRHLTRLLDRSLRQAGLGHIEPAFADEGSAWRRAIEGGLHHMGTTRMHLAPEHGVVDENSRVHGTSNLFITGSSVFPSGGYANPTLTIVALALRLGDHLKRVVSA